MLKISERDRMLLMVIAIIAIIFCSYQFGYRKFSAMTETIKAETETLVAKYNALQPLYKKQDEYKSKTEELKENFDEMVGSFPNGTTQESLIVLAVDVEEKTGTNYTSLTVEDTLPVYTFGRITSSNPNGLGANVYNTNMVGHKTMMKLSYENTYTGTKDMIKYINEKANEQLVIQTIDMGYDADTGLISGNMEMAMYDITGSERPFNNVSIWDIPVGTPNLFVSRIDSILSTSKIITNYDMYVSVLPFEKGKESVVAGLNKDVYNETALVGRGNSLHSVTFVVSGTNGKYKISYKVGDEMYPAENYFEGVDFNCGETIDLLVLSSAREAKEDKTSVKINITNSSDKAVNLFVFGEDEENPRVALGTTTGAVNVEN